MIHYFESTREAYDATMCGENFATKEDIKLGDLLVIESEEVIGVADAWPYAITEEHGELHATKVHTGCLYKQLITHLKITEPPPPPNDIYETMKESGGANEY